MIHDTLKDRLLDLKNLKFELRDIMRYDDVGDYFDNTISHTTSRMMLSPMQSSSMNL